ncbi:uncharacterized protein LOC127858589 [Dreissena polymorpha]|uniref:uncharacterized protein LOC127858589 n=1 Tax=Dreissena polymorpha TaxID=45954 RepID=UPI0022641D40|nr:uncharacterized protein LOC127858589 [Dreissena polymorpha]
MANLPEGRLTPGPPFTYVGVDTFGPWPVVKRRTRGGVAESKRWAIIFVCLVTRASHIEVIEDMSSSAFINALRRFISVRRPVKEFRSDRGTNFVGALKDIKADAICVEDPPVKAFLKDKEVAWILNTPHASHKGGFWERIIGLTRNILNAMLLNTQGQKLTHEVLCTLMCEVCAVLNSRPIGPITYDPLDPVLITPSMLLTQKSGHLTPLTTSTNIREIYASQWKHVQILSNMFWKRWQQDYLSSLQGRRKWLELRDDVKPGDVVLLKESSERNQWPVAVVERVFPGTDERVRSLEVRLHRD